MIPQSSCYKGQLLLAAQFLSVLVIPCNTWLFFLRVRAIPPYCGSRVTVFICGILWFSTCSSAFMFHAFSATSTPVGDGTCILRPEFDGTFLGLPLIAIVVFDTATMIAVVIGFVMNSPARSWSGRIRSVLLIKDMGKLSGTLLRSGQIYYL